MQRCSDGSCATECNIKQLNHIMYQVFITELFAKQLLCLSKQIISYTEVTVTIVLLLNIFVHSKWSSLLYICLRYYCRRLIIQKLKCFIHVGLASLKNKESLHTHKHSHRGLFIWLKDLITRTTRSSSFSPPIGGEWWWRKLIAFPPSFSFRQFDTLYPTSSTATTSIFMASAKWNKAFRGPNRSKPTTYFKTV